MKLKWKNPPRTARINVPPRVYSRSHWGDIADAVRRRPGRWALVAEYNSPNTAKTIGNRIVSGQTRINPAEFDVGVAETQLFLRYTGVDVPSRTAQSAGEH